MRLIVCKAVPPSPNELRRKYRTPHAYKDLREAWKKEIWYMLNLRSRKALQQEAVSKMRVRIIIHHRKFFDPDNVVACLKPVLDALVGLGFLRDDSAKWLELVTPTQQLTEDKRDNKTEIWIGPDNDGKHDEVGEQFSAPSL